MLVKVYDWVSFNREKLVVASQAHRVVLRNASLVCGAKPCFHFYSIFHPLSSTTIYYYCYFISFFIKRNDKSQIMIVTVAIGGSSCSGKSTLVSWLSRILSPDCQILHQDKFYRPDGEIPVSHIDGTTQNWDSPGAHCMSD